MIRAQAVTKSWGSTSVLTDVTVEFRSGITGLLGSNGAGKTTFIGMVLGLHSPDSGRVEVFGTEPASAGPLIRQRIGYSPEHHDLPSEMIAQDLVRHMAEVHGLPARDATQRASDALWLVGLGEERNRPVGTMSTGQRQRVKLAQALAHDPDLLLLDEPTDGLDPVQRDQMLELIRRIGGEFGIDVVLSSHLLEEVERIADNVVILNEGRVVADGPIAELRGDGSGVRVDVEGSADGLAHRLLTAGCDVRVNGQTLQVDSGGISNDDMLDLIRDSIVAEDLGLLRLAGSSRSLEDLFLREVHGQEMTQ